MTKTIIMAVALLGLGASLGTPVAQAQETKQRIFEMRTYTAAPGKLDALQARFRDHTCKLFGKHGMQIVGFWVPTQEPQSQNTLVYILAFPSKEAADKSWKAFRDDPDWKKARADSEVNGKLVEKVESVFLTPADYSPIK